ncbi:MAG: hypothetical protein PHT96_12525 [Syntrophorhabdaceae bacterium]|nr:hypothetical protein [Syntrophorhabdaceae bacterium]
MKKELFEELLESVKQGAAIVKGELKPSRVFHFPETEEGRKTHEKLERSKRNTPERS